MHRLLRQLLPDSRVKFEGVPLDTRETLSVVINKYLQDTAEVLRKIRSIDSILDFEKEDRPIIATAILVSDSLIVSGGVPSRP